MDDPIFAASYMKLQRARGFIAELEEERLRYINSDPLTATIVMVDGEPKLNVNVEGVGLLPGAIIGDAIHNLRVSLDLMASELARINGKSDKDVYFPFAVDEQKLLESAKFKAFRKAGDDCVRELLSLKPYRGGNDAIRAVHDLDVQDKHTALIVAHSEIRIQTRFRYKIDNPMDFTGKATPADFKYKFPGGSPLAGQDAIPTLEQLVETFAGILQTFAGVISQRARLP